MPRSSKQLAFGPIPTSEISRTNQREPPACAPFIRCPRAAATANYNPANYSEAEAIKTSKEVGYKGLFSIESEIYNGPYPYASVQTILDELLKDILCRD